MAQTNSRFEKIVILKHMFTLKELDVWFARLSRSTVLTSLQEDPTAILDIKEDIRDECSKLGEVTNVVLYDKEPNGVATVRFTDPDAARQCVSVCFSATIPSEGLLCCANNLSFLSDDGWPLLWRHAC